MGRQDRNINDRWRRCTRALKSDEQQYGRRFLKVLELDRDRNLQGIDDPLEKAIFLALIGLLKELDGSGLLLPPSFQGSTDWFHCPV